MQHDKDKILLRAKDIGLLVMVITLIGMLLGPLKKTFVWDETARKVEILENRMGIQETNSAVNQSQYAQISKQLDQINWQLRKMRN